MEPTDTHGERGLIRGLGSAAPGSWAAPRLPSAVGEPGPGGWGAARTGSQLEARERVRASSTSCFVLIELGVVSLGRGRLGAFAPSAGPSANPLRKHPRRYSTENILAATWHPSHSQTGTRSERHRLPDLGLGRRHGPTLRSAWGDGSVGNKLCSRSCTTPWEGNPGKVVRNEDIQLPRPAKMGETHGKSSSSDIYLLSKKGKKEWKKKEEEYLPLFVHRFSFWPTTRESTGSEPLLWLAEAGARHTPCFGGTRPEDEADSKRFLPLCSQSPGRSTTWPQAVPHGQKAVFSLFISTLTHQEEVWGNPVTCPCPDRGFRHTWMPSKRGTWSPRAKLGPNFVLSFLIAWCPS